MGGHQQKTSRWPPKVKVLPGCAQGIQNLIRRTTPWRLQWDQKAEGAEGVGMPRPFTIKMVSFLESAHNRIEITSLPCRPWKSTPSFKPSQVISWPMLWPTRMQLVGRFALSVLMASLNEIPCWSSITFVRPVE